MPAFCLWRKAVVVLSKSRGRFTAMGPSRWLYVLACARPTPHAPDQPTPSFTSPLTIRGGFFFFSIMMPLQILRDAESAVPSS